MTFGTLWGQYGVSGSPIRRIGQYAYWGLKIRLLEDSGVNTAYWEIQYAVLVNTAYKETRYGVLVFGQTFANLFPSYLTNRNELEVVPPIVGFVIEFSIT